MSTLQPMSQTPTVPSKLNPSVGIGGHIGSPEPQREIKVGDVLKFRINDFSSSEIKGTNYIFQDGETIYELEVKAVRKAVITLV